MTKRSASGNLWFQPPIHDEKIGLWPVPDFARTSIWTALASPRLTSGLSDGNRQERHWEYASPLYQPDTGQFGSSFLPTHVTTKNLVSWFLPNLCLYYSHLARFLLRTTCRLGFCPVSTFNDLTNGQRPGDERSRLARDFFNTSLVTFCKDDILLFLIKLIFCVQATSNNTHCVLVFPIAWSFK
jgi:hypothetical protein